MNALWFVPVLVLLAGAGAAWWLLARIESASRDVAAGARSFQVLGRRLQPVRVEVERARSSIDRLER